MTPKPKAEETLKACPYLERFNPPTYSAGAHVCYTCPHRRTPAKDEGEEIGRVREVVARYEKEPITYKEEVLLENIKVALGLKPTAPADEGEGKLNPVHINYGNRIIELQSQLTKKEKQQEQTSKALKLVEGFLAEKSRQIQELEAEVGRWKDIVGEEAKEVLHLWEALGISPDNLPPGKCMAELEIETINDLKAKLKSAEAVVDALNLYIKEKTPRNSKDIDGDRVASAWYGMLAALSAHDKKGKFRISVMGPCQGDVPGAFGEDECDCALYDQDDPEVVGYPPFHKGCTCVVERVE